MVGGNHSALMPVYVDKRGRLWREDADTLTLIR